MRPMSTSKPIHIFKPGRHTAMSGAVLEFTEHDLAASAQAYNPAVHEAPLVVGHPKADAPAYGWVKSLAFAENGLQAEPDQIDAAFAELLQAGRFKKVSASFYTPDSPANPVPGVYYLRHVGFLGAQPPAIKGLKQAEFADGTDFVEFSEWDDVQVASLFRNIREWIIGKFSQEEADQIIPQYAVQQLEQSAADELAEEQQTQMDAMDGILPTPAFTENPTGDTMSDQDKARLAELEAENTRLKQQQADFAEQQKRDKAAATHAEHVAFAEGLIKEGRLIPAQKAQIVAMLDYMANDETVVEFGEGDTKQPLLTVIKTDVLAKLPKQVEFSEVGAGDEQSHTVDFAAPEGRAIDQESLRIHNMALAYQAQHKTDYQSALRAVAKH